MRQILKLSMNFLSSAERRTYFIQLISRCLLSLLDLAGVIAIGYLTTSAAMFISNGSDYSRAITILGLSIPAANIHVLPPLVLGILLLFIAKAVFSIVLTRSMAVHLAVIEARAVRVIVENVLGRGLTEARSRTQEELLFATGIGSSSAFTGLLTNFATLVSEGFLFLGLLTTFFLVDPISTISVMAYFGVVAGLIQSFTGSRLAKESTKIVRNSISANTMMNDLSSALRELAVLGRRQWYLDQILMYRTSSAKAFGRQLYLSGMPRYVIETSVLVGVMAFGGVKLLSGDLASSMTSIAIFFTGSMRLVAAMLPWQAALVGIRANIPQSMAAHDLIYAEGTQPEQTSDLNAEAFSRPCKVEAKSISFRYPNGETDALCDVSFTISPGSLVAIIGPSGSGKSTLADALTGLISPNAGEILINGFSPNVLTKANPGIVTYVPQTPGLVSGTISENITLDFSRNASSDELLERTVQNANLASLVASLPHGLETDMGNDKKSFSGGQLQRIGLARALFPQPGLIVMDEATSALDAESEHEIGETITAMRGRATVVLIAHRLHTVQNADLVLLMENGKIVDTGKFSELARRNASVLKAIDLLSIK